MRISDWSSDVCSSDLGAGREYRLSNALLLEHQGRKRERPGRRQQLLYITVEGGFAGAQRVGTMREMPALVDRLAKGQHVAAAQAKIGRASCRERVCPYV